MRLDIDSKGSKLHSKRMRNGTMATITIKNLPPALHAKLKRLAVLHRRSVNSEAIVILELAIAQAEPRDPAAILEMVQRGRARMKGPPLTDELLRAARKERR